MLTSAAPRSSVAVSGAVLATALLAGCATTPAPSTSDGDLSVLASFYPLQYVAEQVGGEHVTVASLTPPGAEPHDLELSPRLVRDLGDADVVVTLAGFQPAVDEAVAARSPEHHVDAAAVPAVAEHLGEHVDGQDAEDTADDGHAEDTADDGHAEGDGHDHAGGDPHFWLDPTLLAAVGHDVADALADADPAHAEDYRAGAERLAADLTDLDEELAAGLASCERDVVVTAHEAFGYLTERYGLEQVGVSGVDPEAEPSPARLREIREVVVEHDVTTIYTEVLLDPAVAETLAADLGLRTAVLDPVESQADPGTDYRDAMESNLAALREGLGCA